jgi:hypothetical protein
VNGSSASSNCRTRTPQPRSHHEDFPGAPVRRRGHQHQQGTRRPQMRTARPPRRRGVDESGAVAVGDVVPKGGGNRTATARKEPRSHRSHADANAPLSGGWRAAGGSQPSPADRMGRRRGGQETGRRQHLFSPPSMELSRSQASSQSPANLPNWPFHTTIVQQYTRRLDGDDAGRLPSSAHK